MSPNVPQADRNQSDMRSRNPARGRIQYSDAEIVDHFRRLGYGVSYDELAFTTESVADFAEARLTSWHPPGELVTLEGGLLIVERAQPPPLQRSLAVMAASLPRARVI